MRRPASWMTTNDGPILEFLEDCELALTPRDLQYNLETRAGVEMAYSTLNHRLGKLTEHDLIEKEDPEGGRYAITDRGRAYLAGELDQDELEETEEN